MGSAPKAAPLGVIALLAIGCHGSASESDRGSGNPIDASVTLDAAADPGSLDASDGDASTGDASTPPISWDGRVPADHRASASVCPQQRPAANGCLDGGGPPSPTDHPCAQDSDCTMGQNGRCLGAPSLVVSGVPESGTQAMLYCTTVCSYDECFTDSDCEGGVPCGCRLQSIQGSPNMCLAASQCAVDSNCSPPAFCSPSPVVGLVDVAYFCHTPNDTCVDDSDCQNPPAGWPWPGPGTCVFSQKAGDWGCAWPVIIQ